MTPIEAAAREDARNIVELFRELNELTDHAAIRCQSKHVTPDNQTCSIEVTHLMFSCESGPDGAAVCGAHVQVKIRQADDGGRCGGCKAPAADCWEWRPI